MRGLHTGLGSIILLLATLPGAAVADDDTRLQLPAQLTGSVEYHWEVDTSDQAGGTLSETITTEAVFRKVRDGASEVVYELSEGTHRFTGYHDQDALGCQSTADLTFSAAPGGARFTVHKDLLTRTSVVYSWAATNTPQPLVRTVWCPGYGEAPRQVVGSTEAWWPSTLPGLAGTRAVQPWGEAFSGTLTGMDATAQYTLSWNLSGAPLTFEPGDRLTPGEKKMIKKYARAKRKHARSWKQLEIGCGVGSLVGGPLAGGCALVGTIVEHVMTTEAEELDEIAEDPPRADYTTVTRPQSPGVRHLKGARTRKGRALVEDLNAYLDGAAERIGLERALLTAMEKAQGADQAGSAHWWTVQLTAIDRYASRVVALMKREDRLGRALARSLRAAGLHGRGSTRALESLAEAPARDRVARIFAGLGR